LFGFVADDMRKGMFGKLAREMYLIARPIAERATERLCAVTCAP
jgi:hypothetical protein